MKMEKNFCISYYAGKRMGCYNIEGTATIIKDTHYDEDADGNRGRCVIYLDDFKIENIISDYTQKDITNRVPKKVIDNISIQIADEVEEQVCNDF